MFVSPRRQAGGRISDSTFVRKPATAFGHASNKHSAPAVELRVRQRTLHLRPAVALRVTHSPLLFAKACPPRCPHVPLPLYNRSLRNAHSHASTVPRP